MTRHRLSASLPASLAAATSLAITSRRGWTDRAAPANAPACGLTSASSLNLARSQVSSQVKGLF
ncbi:MAG TPA: hypothetical protein VMR14_21210 [Streptosporangiaceae bacterium]|nr:hypothetical protein [Streptosporangiaceae bacterium]